MLYNTEEIPDELLRLTAIELRHICWEQLGVRPPLDTPKEVMHKMLTYQVADLGENPADHMRATIMGFISKYNQQLSLPCDGNCTEHTDGVVIRCYRQLLKDTDGEVYAVR